MMVKVDSPRVCTVKSRALCNFYRSYNAGLVRLFNGIPAL